MVREPAGGRPGDEEAADQRQHVDPGPQRGLRKRVAVLRQPDPLQPDDQDELETAAPDRCEQRGKIAGGERPDAEQLEVEHRLFGVHLDQAEHGEEHDAAEQRREHERRGPAHRVPAVGLDPVGDADHDADEPEREGDVAPPVDPRGPPRADLAQRAVGPDRGDETDRDRDEEDETPRHGREHTAEDKPQKRTGDRRNRVHPEREPTLMLRKRVGQDRARVREQERAPDALPDAHRDQPERARAPVHPGDRQEDGEDGEDREAEVVHLHAAVDVAQPAEAHDQDRDHDEEAEDQPEQVARVAGSERVDPDAAKDVRQRDQEDRTVDRGKEHPERRVRERHPLVLELPSSHPTPIYT